MIDFPNRWWVPKRDVWRRMQDGETPFYWRDFGLFIIDLVPSGKGRARRWAVQVIDHGGLIERCTKGSAAYENLTSAKEAADAVAHEILSGLAGRFASTAKGTTVARGPMSRVVRARPGRKAKGARPTDWPARYMCGLCPYEARSGSRMERHQNAEHGPPASHAQVPPTDLWWLLLTSCRYSFGRVSYAASLNSDLVRKYWGWFTNIQLLQTADEIRKHLETQKYDGAYDGAYDDIGRTWEALARDLEVRGGAPGPTREGAGATASAAPPSVRSKRPA